MAQNAAYSPAQPRNGGCGHWVMTVVQPRVRGAVGLGDSERGGDPAGTGPRRCSLSHYRWLDPRALEAVKALRDHYVSDAQTPVQGMPVLPGRILVPIPGARHPGVTQAHLDLREEETLSWRPRNCSLRPRRGPPLPWSCAGLRLVARGLSDAQAVLSRLPSPELFPGVAPTLELLASATRDVVACVSVPGARPLHPRRPALRSPAPQLGPRFSVSRGAPTRPDTIRVPLVSAGLGWEARGLGWWEMGPFASSVYLLCPLQLELARPGSSRKALRAPRRRPQRRRAVSGAGAGRVDGRAGWGGVGVVWSGQDPGALDEEIAASAPLRFLPGFQDSPGCHEATIIFNLVRLLTWDLKLAARSGPCL
ncbi:hypothetical protein QTO34_010407 [Cnephaeus nilssonii]|uniref:Uncharacterized protein n=1 Tax=Cnephaeus nilssonii TaxID=3371016 RepID=A0AA40HFB3_CNENI|nr:hypothetical protein QTO34_010407 [Eptesicus nilssonii]